MRPYRFNHFALALGLTIIIGVSVRAADYNIDTFSGGTYLWATDAIWNPNATGPGTGPLGADNILITGGDLAGTINIDYASVTAATRSITNITVTDSNNGSGSGAQFNFRAGVTGSHLQFATTTPTVTTNITNQNSGAQRLSIDNPLFLTGSTFTKGGSGSVRLFFNTTTSAASWNANVTNLLSTGGTSGTRALWLDTANAITLPNLNFSTDNQKLVISGSAGATATNKTINIGTGSNNNLTLGGNTSLTLAGTTTFTANSVVMGSNNSNEFYLGSSATLNLNGASAAIANLNMGDQKGSTGTVTVNQQAGTTTISNSAFLGAATNGLNGAQTHTYALNVSGGSLAFTRNTDADFLVGRNGRTTYSGTTGHAYGIVTTNAAVTLSGSGILDLGTNTRLVLGTDTTTTLTGTPNNPTVNSADSTSGTLNLNGGTLITKREIARGSNTQFNGTDAAKIFLNGGTFQTTGPITDLFTGFTGTNDGVFVSANGAVIDTNGFNSGITSAVLQDNTASTGGGLTKNGLGTLTLSTASTFTGDTVVNAGTLALGTTLAIQNSTFDSIGAGTLSFGSLTAATFGGLKGSNNLTLSNTTPAGVTLTIGGNNQNTTFSGSLTGLGGLTKTGTGTIVFSGSNTYSGNTGIGSGRLTIATSGALPDYNIASRFSVSGGATLALANGVTDEEATEILGTGNFTAGSILGFDTSSGDRTVANALAGSSAIIGKFGANTLELTATQTYTTATQIHGGTLRLSGSSTTQLASSSTIAFQGTSTLDLNGSAKILKNLQFANAGTTGTVTNGDLTLSGVNDLLLVPTGLTTAGNTATLNMSGLASFTYNNSARPMQVGVSTLSNNKADVSLAGGTNTITASTLSMANGGDGATPFNSGTLRLGQTNVFNLGTGSNEAIRLGGYRSSGNIITFQSGLTNPTLKVRAADGTSRAGDVFVSEANSGTGPGVPINADFDVGIADVKVRDVFVATTAQGGTGVNVNGTISLQGGTFDATSLKLGYVTAPAPTNINGLTATLTHNAGTSLIGTLTMGDTISSSNPSGTLAVFNPTYALVSGTLSAETINANPGGKAFRNTSSRKLDWSSGIITNYNDGSKDVRDLTINGAAGTGGQLAINLLTAGTHTFNTDAGKTLTIGSYASLNGSGPLTKTGDGTLVINGSSSTCTSTLTVNAGTLGGMTNFGGSLDIATEAILAPGNSPGTLGISGSLDLAGLFAYQFTGGASTADLVNVGGVLDLTGASVSWQNLGIFNAGDTFTLFAYTAGNLTGTFTGYLDDTKYNFGGGDWLIDYDDTNAGLNGGIGDRFVTITAVPEPAAALLGGLGLLMLLRRRRHP